VSIVSFYNRPGRDFWPLRSFRKWVSICLSLAALVVGPKFAFAGGVSPTITLPGALSSEYFGLNYANNIATSATVGVLNYSGGPGCGGTCTATTELGADPTVSLNVNEVAFEGAGGGYAEAELAYYVEYYVPGGATTQSYPVTLSAVDTLDVFSGSTAQAYLGLGLAGTSTGDFNNFEPDTPFLVNETDCQNGCSTGVANYQAPAAFPTSTPVQLIENTPYFVQFWVTINPGTNNSPDSAMIDPSFSTTATAGTLIFSPGVGGAAPPTVPEPSTWVMTLLGFFGLAYAAYRRSAQSACA
jgi:hypothetical protein